jgi:peptidoglycan/LPS O-acetylase OafA/YrhL
MNQLPNLNSLRFFLATFVALYHIPQFCANRGFPYFKDWAIFHKGQEAVWVFFSLSGFLIIRQLYIEKSNTQKVDFKRFYTNRILRIFPLYYLILIFGFLFYQLILPSLGFPKQGEYHLAQGILLGGTFFANILAKMDPGGILEILWSISIEEQFYLLIAPIIWILPSRRMLAFFILFTIGYFILYHSPSVEWLQNFRMMFYFFSMSGITAILSVKYAHLKVPKIAPIVVLLVLGLYFSTDLFSQLPRIPYHVLSVILFSFCIWILSKQELPIWNNPNLSYLGKISYGIYMYHPIVMNAVGFLFLKGINPHQMNSTLFILLYNGLVIGGTIFISHLSYQYFEKYFLNKKKSFLKA